jgi:hypothetical protein
VHTQPLSRPRTDFDDDTHPLLLDGFDDAVGRAWPLAGEGMATVAIVLGLLSAIVVLMPGEGRLSVALHDAFAHALGRAMFLIPVVLFGVGGLTLVHRFAPGARLPVGRLLGLLVLGLAALPAEQLLGGPGAGTGAVGQWLAGGLLEWLGGPATVVLLGAGVVVGGLLALDVSLADLVAHVHAARVPDAALTPLPPSPSGEGGVKYPPAGVREEAA